MVVQLDLYGNRDVTDLDGTVMAESDMARRWGVLFTPTIYFHFRARKRAINCRNQPRPLQDARRFHGKLTFLGMLAMGQNRSL